MQAEQPNIFFLPEKKGKKDFWCTAGQFAESWRRNSLIWRFEMQTHTSSGGDFIPAADPVWGIRGDALPSEQHHLPSEPSPGSQDQPWGWFCKAGSPKEPSKFRLSFAAGHAGGRRSLGCCFRAKMQENALTLPATARLEKHVSEGSRRLGMLKSSPAPPSEHATPKLPSTS